VLLRTMFSAVEILLIALLLALILAGGFRSAPLFHAGKANSRENAVRTLLFVILVLLVIGFIVRAVMPLGDGGFLTPGHR
jgi:hypothetical protein